MLHIFLHIFPEEKTLKKGNLQVTASGKLTGTDEETLCCLYLVFKVKIINGRSQSCEVKAMS